MRTQMKAVTHKKTGNRYHIVFDNVIECTNGREDLEYVVYTKDGKLFCREKTEFNQKFDTMNV